MECPIVRAEEELTDRIRDVDWLLGKIPGYVVYPTRLPDNTGMRLCGDRHGIEGKHRRQELSGE